MNSRFKLILNAFYNRLPKFIKERYQGPADYYLSIAKKMRLPGSESGSIDLRIPFIFGVKVVLVDEVTRLNCAAELLFEQKNRVSTITSPSLYVDDGIYSKPPVQGSIPDISVYLLSNVDVVGSTDAVLCENRMYHNELSLMEGFHSIKNPKVIRRIAGGGNEYRLNLATNKTDPPHQVCISLLKEYSSDYYHFTTEVLPKLLTIIPVLEKHPDLDIKNCLLLLDRDLPSPCRELICRVLDEDVPIRLVAAGERVECEKLIYCTPLWVSLENNAVLPNASKEFLLDAHALAITRQAVMNKRNDCQKVIRNKKIYLQAAYGENCLIENLLDIERLLIKESFEFVDCSRLSLAEQLDTFQQAELIVGALSPVFTNLLFSGGGCKAIVFYPSSQSVNYYRLQPLADASNAKLTHLLTHSRQHIFSKGGSTYLMIDDLKNLVKDLTFNLNLELVDKFEHLGCSMELLLEEKNRASSITAPQLYIDGNIHLKSPLKGKVPDLQVCLLTEVDVVGLTDAVIYDGFMHHNELRLMGDYHDLKMPNIFKELTADSDACEYQLRVTANRNPIVDQVCISLLKEHSGNYYHFTTEAIPRLITIKSVLESYEDIKLVDCLILIDEEVSAQSLEMIKLVLGQEISIRLVEKGQLVRCNRLLYCSPLWLSLDNTKYLPNPEKEFLVDMHALRILKDALSVHTLNKKQKRVNAKRIYLQRANTGLRKLLNVSELERLLIKHGFDFIDCEKLSLMEQLDLFSQVEIVVGCSGASFTNIMNMREGTTCVIIYPSAQSAHHFIFQPLADISQTNLIYYLTDPVEDAVSLHAQSEVDVKSLEILIDGLL